MARKPSPILSGSREETLALASDILKLVVSTRGSVPYGEGARGIVRAVRTLISEVDVPTVAKRAAMKTGPRYKGPSAEEQESEAEVVAMEEEMLL